MLLQLRPSRFVRLLLLLKLQLLLFLHVDPNLLKIILYKIKSNHTHPTSKQAFLVRFWFDSNRVYAIKTGLKPEPVNNLPIWVNVIVTSYVITYLTFPIKKIPLKTRFSGTNLGQTQGLEQIMGQKPGRPVQ